MSKTPNKKTWTIEEFAAHVGVSIVGPLVRYPEYEYESDSEFYADDRADSEDCVGFWLYPNGRVEIHCSEDDSHYDSDNY